MNKDPEFGFSNKYNKLLAEIPSIFIKFHILLEVKSIIEIPSKKTYISEPQRQKVDIKEIRAKMAYESELYDSMINFNKNQSELPEPSFLASHVPSVFLNIWNLIRKDLKN